jgi:hypothetical protein
VEDGFTTEAPAAAELWRDTPIRNGSRNRNKE